MRAYLIGGPEDMISLLVRDRVNTVALPHASAMAPAPMQLVSEIIPVTTITYHKIYESHGPIPFAIFVYDPPV